MQKEHLKANLDDMASRYSPPVLPHQYAVDFIPLMSKGFEEDVIVEVLEAIEL